MIDFNHWADFWRYEIGVNVIPADTKNKMTWVKWSDYQDSPIPEIQHNLWKEQNAFKDGMAIIVGKTWHHPLKKDLYLVFIDLDNQKAIDEFCTSTKDGRTSTVTLKQIAEKMIVEQHLDDTSKAHIYFYSDHPYRKKGSDVNSHLKEIDANEIPAFEIKSLGSHGIAFCSPSPHKNGHKYQIIGTKEPETIADLERHIDSICRKYNIKYFNGKLNGNNNNLIPTSELFEPDTKILEGHNRHEALLRIMESLLRRTEKILDRYKIRELAQDWNKDHCQPPLDSREFERQWNAALKFVAEINKQRAFEHYEYEQRRKLELVEEELSKSQNRENEKKNPLRIGVLARLNEEGIIHYGYGQLSSLGVLYKRVRAAYLKCAKCGREKEIVFSHPETRHYFEKFGAARLCKFLFTEDYNDCDGIAKIEPAWVNALDIEVTDTNSLQDIDRIKCILLDNDTEDVGIGENVVFFGSIYMESAGKKGSTFPVCYVQSLKYEGREQDEITILDIDAIKRFRDSLPDDDEFVKKLVSMVACNVIGHENIKEGILYMVTNAKPDKRDKRERIHGAIISNPGRAKTALLIYTTKLMTRSTFETAQMATGLSLLAMVENENDMKVLRLGPVSRSLLASIDEFNKLTYVDQEKFYGAMQEGAFTNNKFGRNQKIVAPVTILASMNPPEDFRLTDEEDRIDLSNMNVIRPIWDRFDLKFYIPPMKDERERRALANAKADLEGRTIPDYSIFIKKYMIYAKENFNPKLTEQAKSICVEAFIEMGEYNPLVSPRVLETLINLTKARARLLLKNEAGAEDAKSVVRFYSKMIRGYQIGTIAPKDPVDVGVEECSRFLKESMFGERVVPYTVKELFRKVCESNDQVSRYISSGVSKANRFDRSNNWKVRNIFERLMEKYPQVEVVGKNPTSLVWCDEVPKNSQSEVSEVSDEANLT